MVTTNLVTSAYGTYNNQAKRSADAATTESQDKSKFADVVEFSASALAASGGEKLSVRNPGIFASESGEQIQMNLTRIFMESLFGEDKTANESTEDELVRTVIEEPVAEQFLDVLVKG